MKKESKVNQAKYVELNLFPEEKEDHQKALPNHHKYGKSQSFKHV